ncbi:MAG: UPF0182 family protein [Candidatus Aenigmarchaeota archaeon]|nr:UPF0182 family protein [Candidatus Aenigmarchaeota archaeon]
MKLGNIIFFVIFFVIMLFSTVMNIFGDLFWFTSIGYENVFLEIFTTNVMLAFLFGLSFFAFMFINLEVAKRLALNKTERKGKRSIDMLLIVITLVLSSFVGTAFARWEVFLKYLNHTPFGTVDPVFSIDIGFYVFSLPFFNHILGFLLTTTVLSIALTFGGYLFYTSSVVKKKVDEEIEVVPGMATYSIDWDSIGKKAESHISFLVGILFFLISYGIYLARYGILFSSNGVVFGAGYTDLNVVLPLLNLLMPIAAVVGIVFMANVKMDKWRYNIYAVGAFVGIAVLGLMISGVTQGFIVSPDEFNMEKVYIEKNIENTLKAYNIDNIEEKMFPISYDLSPEDIENNRGTIDNIRLWDWRPLIQTYDQLQLFRTYYNFNDVDIDRYDINGEYKEVMVSARGLDTRGLAENAQTWVNNHMVYTHGYGVVMNPVDKVSNGLPEFYIKDIPPSSDYFEIERPELYYGDGFSGYAVVKTKTEEFDYPSGESNTYTTYEGTGGVPLSDGFRRLAYAAKFSSVELLVSGSMTPESRLIMYRDIRSRVNKVANFLLFDRDPYIVVSEGKLYWMIDAYTVTDMYPYSEPVYHSGYDIEFNYMRNSVKVVVDAYNGDIQFYVVDSSDPIIQTYSKIFPELFKDYSEMNDDLKKHIRYPEDFFRIQAELYSEYHMKDARVFYNKEDSWEIPNEIYRKRRQEMQPYYIMTKLAGQESEEFILMLPFIPRGKENLIAWMAARSDEPNYGKLLVYQFSKQVLTYGPMQIEAKIDQDTDISQKITLWDQSGSSVIRGNTLVIPIEDSILYIEPIYLEATEKGTLPQLKRVIVAYGDEISMKETLAEALSDVLGSQISTGPSGTIDIKEFPEEILEQISDTYDKAQNALKNGNLAEYAQYVEQIGQIINNWKSDS